MKRSLVAVCGMVLLIVSAHRLPAPISEESSPTPTAKPAPADARPVQPQTPTASTAEYPRKFPSKPKSRGSGAARFAGTWIGRITADKMGDVDVRLVISSDGTSVAQNSKAGVWTRPLTYDGRLLLWQTGPTNAVAWTLMLNPDEQSALVTRTWSRYRSSANFKRVQSY